MSGKRGAGSSYDIVISMAERVCRLSMLVKAPVLLTRSRESRRVRQEWTSRLQGSKKWVDEAVMQARHGCCVTARTDKPTLM